MLSGALLASDANYGIAVSGIAGPGGGSPSKPVGTVWISWGTRKLHHSQCYRFLGTRASVRRQSVAQSLENLHQFIVEEHPKA